MDFNFLASQIKSKTILCLTAGCFVPVLTARANPQSVAQVPPVPAPELPASTGTGAETNVRKTEGMTIENKVDTAAPAAQSLNAAQPQSKPGETTSGQTPTSAVSSGTTATGAQPTTETSAANQATTSTPNTGEAAASAATTDASKTNPQAATLPNGAAIQAPLLPLGQSDAYPWSTLAAGAFMILGMAATGVMVVKLKQGRAFRGGKSERQLQLVTSMALSPKRQIMLVRIRDKEVALASTEHGITLLTELPAAQKGSLALLDDGGNEEPRRRKVQQKLEQEESIKLVASSERADDSVGNETAIARSEMLVGALKNLRERNLRNKSSINDEPQKAAPTRQASSSANAESGILNQIEGERARTQGTMKQTRAAFPKYLANAFEQESKRNLNQGQTQSQAQNQAQQSQDDASSVTSMIRERLKDLRPLS